jgi:alpha-N-arabinofuranosidase
MVDAIGTVDEKHSIWSIALVNRHPSQKAECEIQLKGILLDGTFDASVLAGDSPEAYNDIENPQRVVPESKQLMFKKNVVKLAPHSLTIVKIPVK